MAVVGTAALRLVAAVLLPAVAATGLLQVAADTDLLRAVGTVLQAAGLRAVGTGLPAAGTALPAG